MSKVRSGHRHLIVTIAASEFGQHPCQFSRECQPGLLISTTLLVASAIAACGANDNGESRPRRGGGVDGMRPDLITTGNAPALSALVRSGCHFQTQSRRLSQLDDVNGAGACNLVSLRSQRRNCQPGILARDRSEKLFDTGLSGARRKSRDQRETPGAPTIAEILQAAGHWTAVAGAKPVAQFFDRSRTRTSEAAKSRPSFTGGRFSCRCRRQDHKRPRPIPRAKTFPNRAKTIGRQGPQRTCSGPTKCRNFLSFG